MAVIQHFETAQRRHAAYYLGQLQQISETFRHGGEHIAAAVQQFKAYWGQIQQGQSWAASKLDDYEAASMCMAFAGIGKDLLTSTQSLHERLHWLEVSLAAAKHLGHYETEIENLVELGELRLSVGEHSIDDVTDLYQQALLIARKHNHHIGEAHSLLSLGRITSLVPAQFDTAREYLQTALAIYQTYGDNARIGECLRNLGVIEERTNNFELAKTYQNQALQIFRQQSDHRQQSITLSRLASIAEREGNYEVGKTYAEEALKIARTTGDLRTQALCLGILGLIVDYLGESAKSEQHFAEMQKLCLLLSDKRYLMTALANLAYLAAARHDYANAEAHNREMLDIAQQMGIQYRICVALTNIANIEIKTFRLHQVHDHLWQGLSIAHEIQAEDVIRDNLLDYAFVAILEGHAKEGAEIYGAVLGHPLSDDPEAKEGLEWVHHALNLHLSPPKIDQHIHVGRKNGAAHYIEKILASPR